MKKTVYFDNAATTFPKPESVYKYADMYVRNSCGNPGRGSHKLALAASEELYRAREALASLFAAEPENIAFTMNTTYALNTAVKGAVGYGEHVLISNMEHNSVLRPVDAVCRERNSRYSVFDASGDAQETLESIRRLTRKNTKTLVCTHVSNIIPKILPISLIGDFCRANGITFIVDGAQSAGIYDIDIERDNIDILCVPGHKGLYGFQGAAAIIFGNSDKSYRTLVEGGSGTDSVPVTMPEYYPDRFEAGTLPSPAIAAFGEGVRWVISNGTSAIRKHEEELCGTMLDGLSSIRNAVLYSTSLGSTVLFNIDGVSPAEVSEICSKENICVRSGLHCAPLAHKTVGSFPSGGVRVGFSAFNTISDVKKLLYTLSKIQV